MAAGYTRHAIAHQVSTGRWTTVRRGAYCRTADWQEADTRQRHLVAVEAELLRVPDRYVVSHESAAAGYGWPTPWRGLSRVWFTSDRPHDKTLRTDYRVVEVATLRDEDLDLSDGRRRTSAARTVADVLRHVPVEDAVAMADAAVNLGHTSIAEVAEVLRWQSGWPKAAIGRRALALVDGRRETYLESSSFVRLSLRGVPLPLCQVYVFDASGRFVGIVDGLWLRQGVVAECDGRTKYDLDVIGRRDPAEARRQLLAEKRREDALRSTQLGVVRWGTHEVRHDLDGLAARVRAALATGDIARFTGSLRTSYSPADTIDLSPYRR
jgi:hypothetical protein